MLHNQMVWMKWEGLTLKQNSKKFKLKKGQSFFSGKKLMPSSQQPVTFFCSKDTGIKIIIGVKLQGRSDSA